MPGGVKYPGSHQSALECATVVDSTALSETPHNKCVYAAENAGLHC